MYKVFIATALGCCLLTSVAFADGMPRHIISTESVRTDDLDLKTAAGARQMFRRIMWAADSTCHQPRSEMFPRASYEIARCNRETIARAVRDLNAPLVTAAHETWTNAPAQSLAAR